MLKQLHLIISGNVQGVLFRANTKEKAVELGLVGWVKNNPDGTVEALFQGEKDKLDEILEFCKKGPESAEVKDVKTKWQNVKEKLIDFRIVH